MGKSQEDYSHPDHAEMEWHHFHEERREITVEGWKCTRCHVIGHPDRVDKVFDEHDCDQYAELRKGITGNLP